MGENNYKSVKTVLWVILFANFLVAAVKIGVGIACKSQSVTADGIHSFSDGASNIVGLIGIWFASKPTDLKHPYGHRKFEVMASLFIGVMLAFMSVKIISRAIVSFENPVQMEISLIQGILMVATIIVNTFVAVTEFRWGKRLKSTILITDSLHTRGDIMISCAVLLGLFSIRLGTPVWVDAAMSLVVAVAVMISALKIIKDCVDVLVDSAVVDSEVVKKIIMNVPGVYDVHNIRSRGGLSQAFIDCHVIVNPDENVVDSHNLSHELEKILRDYFGEDTEAYIHIEPDDGLHNK